MLCPFCYADIPDDQYNCPGCGKKVEGPASFPGSSPDSDGSPWGSGSSGASGGSDSSVGSAGSSGSLYSGAVSYPDQAVSVVDAAVRPFKDPEAFQKILIGALIGLIPLAGGIIQSGYMIEYMRRVIRRENPSVLPGWNNWQAYLVPGLLLFLGGLIYLTVVGGISTAMMLPFMGTIMVFGQSDSNDPAAVMAILSSLALPLIGIAILVMIILFIYPALHIQFSKNQNFMELLNLSGAVRMITGAIGDYLSAILVLTAAVFIVFSIAGVFSFIPIVGFLVNMCVNIVGGFVFTVIAASVYGEFYYKNYGS